MCTSTERFFNEIADNFIADRLHLIARHFVYPLPFYAGDKLQVFGSDAVFAEALQLYRDAVRDAGIVRIIPRFVASGLAVDSMSGVWVEWDHIDRNGHIARTSQVRYFLNHRGGDDRPKIEMIEYTDSAFPEVTEDFPMVATA